MTPTGTIFPLFERFPALTELPRVELCVLPTPVQPVSHRSISGEMWIKRDDLTSPFCGGNKVRSLEFLLGGLEPGDNVITVGGAGSTHVLSTAEHSVRLGASLVALRWKHDMNPTAHAVSSRISEVIPGATVKRSAMITMLAASYRSWKTGARYIPIGGSNPLGALGHVNAALELARQINDGAMPTPKRLVLPLGTGGTTAGLLLGFAIADLPIEIVGVRVGPRAFVNRRNVLSLVKRTSDFIERMTGERLPEVSTARLRIVQDYYGGAYGRPLPQAEGAESILREAMGIRLDGTYSAKAWAAALRESAATQGPVLFWLTFDARCLTS